MNNDGMQSSSSASQGDPNQEHTLRSKDSKLDTNANELADNETAISVGAKKEGDKSKASDSAGSRSVHPKLGPGKILPEGFVLDQRFKIISMIGKGGMCVVYKALNLHLHQVCAVKILHPHLIQNEDARQRFQREAIAASSLKHPNIIELTAYGFWESQPFMVMEFLDGESLADTIKKNGPLTTAQAIPIFTQICDALSEAHDKGVIHRDLKPSNVMLPSDSQVLAKLVDFGIAKVLPSSGKELQKLTQTGDVLGTVVYMSPEQCQGKLPDPRSDIYSMGCLMYEVLTGKAPFAGKTTIETMSKHLTEEPKTSELLNHEFNTLLLRTLDKDPQKRPQSARELKAELMQIPVEITHRPKSKKKSATKTALVLLFLSLMLIANFSIEKIFASTCITIIETAPGSNEQKAKSLLSAANIFNFQKLFKESRKILSDKAVEIIKTEHPNSLCLADTLLSASQIQNERGSDKHYYDEGINLLKNLFSVDFKQNSITSDLVGTDADSLILDSQRLQGLINECLIGIKLFNLTNYYEFHKDYKQTKQLLEAAIPINAHCASNNKKFKTDILVKRAEIESHFKLNTDARKTLGDLERFNPNCWFDGYKAVIGNLLVHERTDEADEFLNEAYTKAQNPSYLKTLGVLEESLANYANDFETDKDYAHAIKWRRATFDYYKSLAPSKEACLKLEGTCRCIANLYTRQANNQIAGAWWRLAASYKDKLDRMK